jgi:hypothetical protein
MSGAPPLKYLAPISIEELGADASVTEQVYRGMIGAFIKVEIAEHDAQQGNTSDKS